MIQIILLILLSASAQSTFETALAHKHEVSITWEMTWVKTTVVPAGTVTDSRGQKRQAATAHILGNSFVARQDSGQEVQFFHLFDSVAEGPMLSMLLARGGRVAVTFDPTCFYATKLAIVSLNPPVPAPTPSPTVSPTPKPSPTPTPQERYSYVSKTWPSGAAARQALLNEMGAQGYRLAQVISSTAYFERKQQ